MKSLRLEIILEPGLGICSKQYGVLCVTWDLYEQLPVRRCKVHCMSLDNHEVNKYTIVQRINNCDVASVSA